MKRIILGITFLMIALSANAQAKIGTIDAEFILSQMPGMVTVNNQMKDYNEALQANLDTTIVNYEAKIKDYEATASGLAEDIRKEKESEILQLENDIKGFRNRASVLVQMKRGELTGPLYEKINTAMQEVIQEEGYTQVFHAGGNTLAFSRPEDDITEKVLNKLGLEMPEQQPETSEQ